MHSMQRKCAPATACYDDDDDVDDNNDAKSQKDNTKTQYIIPKRNSLRMHIIFVEVCECACKKKYESSRPSCLITFTGSL